MRDAGEKNNNFIIACYLHESGKENVYSPSFLFNFDFIDKQFNNLFEL